ncbi:MAG TPA: FAD:protein FMN transferase [Pirellulales bacterium]|nr:FAD:protein FMN transferase [Pirellulales bacterium]
MMNRSLIRSAGVVAFSLYLFVAATFGSDLVALSGNTMGTTYSIKFHAVDDAIAREPLQSKIDLRLKEIDGRMSTYQPQSEVSRFNRAAAGIWFPVSDDTASVVAVAQDIARKSGGAFDITVGPLVRLWNFGAASDPTKGFVPPSAEQIRAAQATVGFERLEVRAQPPALRKSLDGLEIDLSGIAKGFAVDRLCEILQAHQLDRYMVEIGGEVRVSGTRSDGQRWTVGVESPDRNARRLQGTVRPLNSAIASSGDYRIYHEYDGVVYSHTIDPRSGRPIRHELAAVTILAEDCATADALATAVLVLGPVEGKQWAEEHGIAALLFSRSPEGTTTTRTSHFNVPFVTDHRGNAPAKFGRVLLTSIIVFAIALVGMSIGVIVSNRRLKGSCGGLAGLKDERGKTLCDACSNPSPDCAGNDATQKSRDRSP